MSAVFGDTFYFLALLNSRDQWHARVAGWTATMQSSILTTAPVLIEVADAMAQPSDRLACAALLDDLFADPNVEIVVPDQELIAAAIALFADRADKRWSLTDCISFTVMQRPAVTEALTGDRDFDQAGFNAIFR